MSRTGTLEESLETVAGVLYNATLSMPTGITGCSSGAIELYVHIDVDENTVDALNNIADAIRELK